MTEHSGGPLTPEAFEARVRVRLRSYAEQARDDDGASLVAQIDAMTARLAACVGAAEAHRVRDRVLKQNAGILHSNSAPISHVAPEGPVLTRRAEEPIMPTRHQEQMLDSGIEESFPASDPVSVFIPVKQKPLPWERPAPASTGVPWARIAASAVPLAMALAGSGMKLLGARRAVQRREQRRRRMLTALGGVLGGLLVIGGLGRAFARHDA